MEYYHAKNDDRLDGTSYPIILLGTFFYKIIKTPNTIQIKNNITSTK